MPILHFHLAEGHYATEQHERLLTEASRFFADVLRCPIDRVRAFIHLYRPELTAVGGVLVSREARRAGREWAANDPGPEPRLFLAKVLDSSGHGGEAKQILDDWLAKPPDSTDARRLRARLGGGRKPTRR